MLSAEEKKLRSETVCNVLKKTVAAWQSARQLDRLNIAIYAAMTDEVSLDAFIQQSAEMPWRLFWPCMLASFATELAEHTDGVMESGQGTDGKVKSITSEIAVTQDAAASGQAEEDFCSTTMVMLAPPDSAPGKTPFIRCPARVFSPQEDFIKTAQSIQLKDLDVVVVPLVAFDRSGTRLGYGGGNYDRFLVELSSETLVIGVAFSEQSLRYIPAEPHDRFLPIVIYS